MTTTTQKFASLMPFSNSENINIDRIHGDDNISTSTLVTSLSSSSTLNSIASGMQQTTYRKQQKQLYDNSADHSTKRRTVYSSGYDSNNYLTTSAKPSFKNQQNNLTHTKNLPFSTSATLTTTSSSFNQQQQDSDCGSSSGLGGTNNCSSDSSLLDSDSRDSGSRSNSVVNKIPDISKLTTASIITSDMTTLSTIPLTISNILPPLQPVLGTKLLTPLNTMPSLPPQLNSNAPHLLLTTNFVNSSTNSIFTGSKSINKVITTSNLSLNNTNVKQWPSTSVSSPVLSHPSAKSSVKPFYTMTCEAAAIAAAAAAAAAGYHVSYGTDCWFTNQNDNTPGASAISNLPNSINNNVHSDSLPTIFNSSNASTSNANNLSNVPSNITTAISSGHDLFVHIHPGDAISLAVGNEIRHIPGPATIRMVSRSAPPSAIPMNVAQGHVVQQLLDRQGMLSHVIMSKEGSNIVNVGNSGNGLPPDGSITINSCINSTNYNSYQKSQMLQNSCSTNLQKLQIAQQQQTNSCIIAPSVLQQQSFLVQQQRVSPLSMLMPCPFIITSNSNSEQMINTNTFSFSNTQKKWNAIQNNNTTLTSSKRGSTNSISSSIGASSNLCQSSENTSNYLTCNSKPNKTVQSSYNESSIENENIRYNIENNEKDFLLEILNNIQSPTVTRISAREADILWEEIDISEAVTLDGSFPQIDASKFTYEIFVYEGQQTLRCIMQHRCNFSVRRSNTPAPTLNLTPCTQTNTSNNVFCLTRLKPGTDYLVNIRASLLERELYGNSSPHTLFRTLPCQPDAPQMPKLIHRQLINSFTISWKQPANNGSPIIAYILQLTKNKTENFETIYEGLSEQWKFVDPDPNVYYRFRVIARNELGNSEPSTSLIVTPSALLIPSQSSLANNQSPSLLNSNHLTQQSHHHSHGILPNVGHHLSQSSKSHIIFQKLSPPTVLSVSARAIRLSWNYPNEFFSVTLEMCNFTRANPNIYNPIPSECYASSGTFASINGLQSNREYRFRLVGLTQKGDSLRSDYVSVKTHKDRYENASYYQNYQQQQQHVNHYSYSTSQLQNSEKEYQISTPIQLHKYYDDENCVEIGWKFSGRDHENITFIVEGTTLPFNNDDNNLLEKNWIVCYKGTANNAIIQDPYLCLFRVQAINNFRHITSAWSETLLVKRILQPKKIYQKQHLQQKISQQSIQNDNSQKQQKEVEKETIENQSIKKLEKKLNPVQCTTPKFSNITHNTAHVSWGINDNNTKTDKISINTYMIYELQRVDKQPPIIIYSGNEFEYELKNLKTVEHMQVRVRSVILDAEGKRIESEWSSVGSACTLCTVTSAPRNLKLGRKNENKKNAKDSASVSSSASSTEPNTPEHHVNQRLQLLKNKLFIYLNWNPPSQLNGSDVIEYYIFASRYTLINKSDTVDNELTNLLLENQTFDMTNEDLLAENEKIGTTSDTFYLVKNLVPAQRYFFYVCAKNEAGLSPKSNIIEYISSACVPDSPENFKAEALSISEIKLNWTAPNSNGSLITSYKITVQKLVNPSTLVSSDISNSKHHICVFVSQHFVSADETSFIVTALETKTLYEFLIEAENSIGTSSKEKVKCLTLSPPPNPPILILANAQANGLKLKWTNSAQSTTKSDVCYYYLEKENENATFSRVYEGELHSAKIKGLKERSIHRFRIRAALARNVMLSPWSKIYEFSTIRQPPPGLRSAPIVSELEFGIFQVEWQPLRCVNLLQLTSNGTKDEPQQQNQLIYRLQISSKMSRDKTTSEPWRTAYEGTASICTLKLHNSAVTRQARVLVVQKYFINDQNFENKKLIEIEESVSAPSPITIFSTTRSSFESSSPKKRLLKSSINYALTSTNNTLKNNVTETHDSVHIGNNKISINRKIKRFISWIKKTISEKDCALIVLIVFVILAISIAILLNNYYQF